MTSSSTDRLFGANSSLAIKAPCRVATTGNITLSANQTIDGVATATGDRVLVKNQTDSAENGIYIADSSDWQRAPDFDGNRDIAQGTAVHVVAGGTNATTWWEVTSANPIVVDTDDIVFALSLTASMSTFSFLQSGTGAVVRTALAKMRDAVCVRDFGAVGDGATDDTAAIQAAIDYVNGVATVGTPSELYFPSGVYITSSTLTLTWSGKSIHLRGDHPGIYGINTQGAILKFSGAGPVLTISGAATPSNYVVENLHFLNNAATQNYGIKLLSCFYPRLINCIFSGFNYASGTTFGAGVWVTSTVTGTALLARFTGCYFSGCANGIYYDTVDSNVLVVDGNCSFINNTKSGIRLGDYINTAFAMRSLSIRDSHFEGNTEADIHAVGGVDGCTIDGNYLEWTGTKIAINLASNAAHPIHNAVGIENNTFSGIPANAAGVITVAGCSGLRVWNNFAAGAYTAAKYWVNLTSNVTNYEVKAPSMTTGSTLPVTVRDGATSHSDANYSDKIPEIGSWVPTDGSGAALALTLNGTQLYKKLGREVTIWFDLNYPATADGTAAKLGSLPFTAGSFNFAGSLGLSQSAQDVLCYVNATATTLAFIKNNTGGTGITNAELTGCRMIGSATYLTA